MNTHHSFRTGLLAILLAVVLPLGCRLGTTDIVGPTSNTAVESPQAVLTAGEDTGQDTEFFIGEEEDHHHRDHRDDHKDGHRRDVRKNTVSVTPSRGGVLRLSHSKLVLFPGSVTRSFRVSWQISKEKPRGLNGGLPGVYEFSPDGLQFKVPAMAFISFEDAGLRRGDPRDYSFFYLNESTGSWEKQKTKVNTHLRRFVVTMHHFSRYAFGRLEDQRSAAQDRM